MKALSKGWQNVEVLIGLTLVIIQSAFLYYFYEEMKHQLELLPILEVMAGEKVSRVSIALRMHLTVLPPLATIVGGILLLNRSRVGWHITAAASILSLLLFTDLIYISAVKDLDIFTAWVILSFLFCLIIMVLFSKPFMERYTPSSKSMKWIIGALLLAILDFWLVHFFAW